MSKFSNAKKVFHQWGGTTATFFAYTHLSHDLCAGLVSALLPLIRAGLRLNYLQSGLLLSAYSITSGLSQFVGGWLGDRFSRQMVIALGLSGVGLATLAVGLSSAYYPTLAILVIMGIFAGAYHPSATPMLSGYFEESKWGKVIAIHMLGGSFGFAMAPVLGGLIAGSLGWRSAFVILSIPALLAVPLLFRWFRQKEHVGVDEMVSRTSIGDAPVKPIRKRTSLRQVLRLVGVITTLAILTQLIAGSASAFVPIYLVDKHNIAPAHAAMLVGVIRGGAVVGSLFGGWLSDRWSRRNAIFLALVATGPILFLLTKLPFNPALIVIFVLFGLVMNMRQSTIQPLLVDSTPLQLRATVFGIYFGLSMEGMSLMQPVVGHFMDVFSITDVFHVIALTSVGLSLVALFLVKRPGLH